MHHLKYLYHIIFKAFPFQRHGFQSAYGLRELHVIHHSDKHHGLKAPANSACISFLSIMTNAMSIPYLHINIFTFCESVLSTFWRSWFNISLAVAVPVH